MMTGYAVAAAAILGAAAGAAAARGLGSGKTPKAYIVTEVDVTGDMAVFQRDYAAHARRARGRAPRRRGTAAPPSICGRCR